MKNKSVMVKLISTVLMISIVGMFLAAAMCYIFSRKIVINESLAKAKYLAGHESEKINNWINSKATFIKSVGVALKESGSLAIVQDVCRAEAPSGGELISVYCGFSDDSGIFSGGSPDFATWRATERGWYKQAKEGGGRVVLTSPYQDALTGKVCATMAQDIGEIEGLGACFAIDVDISFLTGLVSSIKVGNGGYAFMVGADGAIISHPDARYNPTAGANFFMSGDPAYAKAYQSMKGNEENILLTDYDGVERYIIPSGIGETGWALFTAVPKSNILSPLYRTVALTIIFCLLIAAVSAAIFHKLLGGLIIGPLKTLQEMAGNLAAGNLNMNFATHRGDEIGALTQSFQEAADVVKGLTSDLTAMSAMYNEQGETDVLLDEGKYKNDYARLAGGINAMMIGHASTLDKTIGCLGSMARGDFDAPIEQFPGKRAHVNESIEGMRRNLRDVSDEIGMLLNKAIAGDLSARANESRFSGGWRQIAAKLNEMLADITGPVRDVSAVMHKMAAGNLSERMADGYQGELALLAQSLNGTLSVFSEYIEDISGTLNQVAGANLDVGAEKEYIGDFSKVKQAVDAITAQLNNTIRGILSASEQLSSGMKNISESSSHLAGGAVVQTNAVRKLTEEVGAIKTQAVENAEGMRHAKELSERSKESALGCSAQMGRMLDSMEAIKTSSRDISGINKTIEDIAFQTNLLALNASVEAARAGAHGRGFSVVADQVKMLASKSQQAANRASGLIEQSLRRVEEGVALANATADSMTTIIEGVNDISGIISNIAAGSEKQAAAVGEVNTSVDEISKVIHDNSAVSEEFASMSEQLTGQSETLTNMVSVFTLKPDRARRGERAS